MSGGDKLIYDMRSQPFTRMLLEHKMPTMCKSLGDRAVNKADMVSRYEILTTQSNNYKHAKRLGMGNAGQVKGECWVRV